MQVLWRTTGDTHETDAWSLGSNNRGGCYNLCQCLILPMYFCRDSHLGSRHVYASKKETSGYVYRLRQTAMTFLLLYRSRALQPGALLLFDNSYRIIQRAALIFSLNN